jgi:hypothetical protein
MSLEKLAARRIVLIERIAQQRDDVVLLSHAIERPLRFVDKGYAFIQKVRQQPKLVLAGTLLLAAVFHKSLLSKKTTLLAIAEWFLFKKK